MTIVSSSLYVGLEDGNLLLNGIDNTVQVNQDITIYAYEFSASILVFADMGAMVLMQVAVFPGPGPPTYSGRPSDYLNVVGNSDFGPSVVNNPNASQIGGGIGGGGMLCSLILKSALGESANQAVALSGLEFQAPKGSWIAVHLDGGGSSTKVTDGEIQGAIFYRYGLS